MIYQPYPFKTCSTCHQWKSINDFCRNKAQPDGLQNQCHACNIKYRKENADIQRAVNRKSYHKYPEKNREYSRQYRIENPESVAASQSRYWKENPEKNKLKHWRRMARKLSLPDHFTDQDWDNAVRYFGGKCAICGRYPDFWQW